MGKGKGWHGEPGRHAKAARGIKTGRIRQRLVRRTHLQSFLFNRYRKELWKKILLQLRRLAGKHIDDYGIGPVSGVDSILVFGSFATTIQERPSDIDVVVFRQDNRKTQEELWEDLSIPSSEFHLQDIPITGSAKLDIIQASVEDKQQILKNFEYGSRKKYGEAAFIDVTQDVLN